MVTVITRIPLMQLKKLLHGRKSNNWPMVSFINNGSEITLEMGIASKPKAQNLEQHF